MKIRKKISLLEAAKEKAATIDAMYERYKKIFIENPCHETKQRLFQYLELLHAADKEVLQQQYREREVAINYNPIWPEYCIYESKKAQLPKKLTPDQYLDEVKKIMNETLI